MGWMSPHYVRLRNTLARADELGSSQNVLERIRLNLDRARVLPGPWTHHIVVDAASARLWSYQDGEQRGMMRAAVGAVEKTKQMPAGRVHTRTTDGKGKRGTKRGNAG